MEKQNYINDIEILLDIQKESYMLCQQLLELSCKISDLIRHLYINKDYDIESIKELYNNYVTCIGNNINLISTNIKTIKKIKKINNIN